MALVGVGVALVEWCGLVDKSVTENMDARVGDLEAILSQGSQRLVDEFLTKCPI